MLLIRGILAALRQKFHLTTCPNSPGHLSAFVAGCVLTVGALAYFTGGPFNPDAQAGGAWRELVQLNPDPRPLLAAGEVRTDRATGRRYHAGVSLWMDPSPPPPGPPVKAKGGQ